MGTTVSSTERQKLLDDYAATSLKFSTMVQRLRVLQTDVEAFIQALAETGTAHRACERSRIRLSKHLAGGHHSAAVTAPGHLTAGGH
jgi:hypothetical protein